MSIVSGGDWVQFCPTFLPQPLSDLKWSQLGLFPPILLIPRLMKLAVMRATQRHREFVTYLETHGSRLGEPNVMSV